MVAPLIRAIYRLAEISEGRCLHERVSCNSRAREKGNNEICLIQLSDEFSFAEYFCWFKIDSIFFLNINSLKRQQIGVGGCSRDNIGKYLNIFDNLFFKNDFYIVIHRYCVFELIVAQVIASETVLFAIIDVLSRNCLRSQYFVLSCNKSSFADYISFRWM